MEWTELQALWQQYDARIVENTRINKEILKRMLRTKPERKISWITLYTGANLFLTPVAFLLVFTLLPFKYNHGLALYIGIFLYGCCVLLAYCRSIKYFMLLRTIDFTHSVITTRKNLMQLEEFQTKMLQLRSLLTPIAVTGILMMFNMPFFTKPSVLFLSLIIMVMVVSMYYRFRWKNRWFGKLNDELDEIEQLEKE